MNISTTRCRMPRAATKRLGSIDQALELGVRVIRVTNFHHLDFVEW